MHQRFQELARKVTECRGQYNTAANNVKVLTKSIEDIKQQIEDLQHAKDIITVVSQKTQKNLQYQLSDIVSDALYSVFDREAPNLHVEFVRRRNKMECDLLFDFNGNLEDPRAGNSGGGIDVASFALRIISLLLRIKETAEQHRLQPCIFFDEPFKNVSAGYIQPVVEMVAELSKKLGIQLIITTHMTPLVAIADKVIDLTEEACDV